MYKALHIDFETRSTVNLKIAGLDVYSKDPTTDMLCLGFAFDHNEPEVITDPLDLPLEVINHIRNGGVVVAHNAQFELAIWNEICYKRYGWPIINPEQIICTMALAYAMALPGALENAAPAAGIKHKKDMPGHRLMLQMCAPRTRDPLTWWDSPDKIKRLCEYCVQDVKVEQELYKRLTPLSPHERKIWVMDYRINQRGVCIDQKAIVAAVKIVKAEQERMDKTIQRLTEGYVSRCTEVKRIGDWLRTKGVDLPALAKADVIDALKAEELPEAAREVLLLRQESAKTSTAKLQAMVNVVGPGGRIRNMFQYHGTTTGRWAGRKVQLQNLVRPKLKPAEVEDCIAHLTDPDAAEYLSMFYGNPLDVVSWSLRGMLMAGSGMDLIAADFSNIEGRGLAWLAGDEKKLKRFRDFDAGNGPDIYIATASDMTGKPLAEITDFDRQAWGKVTELSMGYGGGVGAYQKMAKGYGVSITDEKAEWAKDRWRENHPKIVQYWYALERAAIDAIRNKGTTYGAGAQGRKVLFKVKGSFLWAKLPSGRLLCYPYPRLDTSHQYEKPDGKKTLLSGRAIAAMANGVPADWNLIRSDDDRIWFMAVDGITNKWGEASTYGGSLAENITQAFCRDILADAMLRLEARGYSIVMHVHDEPVAEVPKGFGSLDEFREICEEVPPWAEGLPIAAGGWRGQRYRK